VEMGRSATVLGWSSGVLPTEQRVQSTEQQRCVSRAMVDGERVLLPYIKGGGGET
jgi:hypothetical protein